MKKAPATNRAYRVELLEPRLLLAADWAIGLAPGWGADSDLSGPIGDVNDYLTLDSERLTPVPLLAALPDSLDLNALLGLDFAQDDLTQDAQTVAPDATAATVLRHELVIIDAGVEGHEQLVADFEGRNGGDTYYDVRVLATDADGVQALSAILAGYNNLDALHIVSHGGNGGVQLGDARLDATSIDGYAQQIGSWSSALGDSADLLIYGCDLAASDTGQSLVEKLGALTLADVAASDDETGLAERGGDWDFEYTLGDIESTAAFTAQIQSNWSGLLASFTVNTFADTVDINPGDGVAVDAAGNTSLRAAIMEANALAGADSITLVAGNYLLAIGGDDNTSAGGDLDITEALSIVGDSSSTTTIDAQGIDRVLHVFSTGVTIVDVTLTGGVAMGAFPDGGALFVETGAGATLERVVVTGNSAQDGGGLFSNGSLTLRDVTVSTNNADQNGGGIRLSSIADLSNVTVSGNMAGNNGAGILIASGTTATLTNVTISGNDASSSGGGLRVQGAVSFVNVTVADNTAGGVGGGVSLSGGGASVAASNSIFAENTAVGAGNDFNGSVSSDGSNIIKDNAGSTGFVATEIADPLLDLVLSNNGGLTLTHALLAGSPARDNINAVATTPSDQRGYARDLLPDIGAYEYGAVGVTDTGMAIWAENGSTSPQYSAWDGSSFGPNGVSAPVGEYRTLQAAEAPSRDEVIVVGVDPGSTLSGEIWNGTSWAPLPFNNFATVSASFPQGTDVAYESLSGDAIVVWNNGTDVSYRVWDGSTWTAEATVAVPLAGEPKQVALTASPLSDEIIMYVTNTADQDYVLVWNGSAWVDSLVLATIADSGRDVWVAYESQSGDAMVVYGESSLDLRYRIWDGSTWSAEAVLNAPVGVAGDVGWAKVDSDPNSDRLALAVYTGNSEVWLAVWDGSATWDTQLATTSAPSNEVFPNVDVAFEAVTGEVLAVYAETTAPTNEVRFRVWDGSWSTEMAGPDIGALANTLVLEAAPNTNGIMLAVQNDNAELNYVLWDGAAWGTPTLLESDSGEIKNEPFAFVWNESSNAMNNPPVANDDSYDVDLDTTLVIDAASGLLNNDTDLDFDPLTLYLLSEPLNGTISLNPVGLTNLLNLSTHASSDIFPDWSPDSSQIAFASVRDGDFEIYVINADGTGLMQLTSDGASERQPVWSPDGTQILYRSDAAGTFDIYVMDADGNNPVRLTTGAAADGADELDANWSPDGSKIVFVMDNGTQTIYVMDADGSNVQPLTTPAAQDRTPTWSPDGTRIVFVSDRDGNDEIYVMDADGSNVARLTTNAAADGAPAWSPDGSRILFHSNIDGDDELFVMDADGSNVYQITNNLDSDSRMVWSPDGTRIAFQTNVDGNNEIYVASIVSDGAFTYTPNPGYTGVDSFTYQVTDGIDLSDPATVILTVAGNSGVDTVVTSPTDSTTENTDLVFSVANGNAITVDDGTTNDPVLRTTLIVTNGVLNLATTAGLISVAGDGTNTVIVIGAESAINAALDGLTFSPTASYTGAASLQVTTDMQADLLGYYNFSQSNPLGLDSSPSGGNDATPSGPGSLPDPNSVFDADRNSDVLMLDGIDDNLVIPGRFGTPTNVTVAAWVYVSAVNNQEVVSIGGSIALRLNDINNGAGVTGFYNDGSGWNHTDSGQFIGGDGWHHVAFTFDDVNNTQVIYIDGVALGTTGYAGSINWAHQLNTTIGSHANGSSYWLDGMMDDVRIYERALSASEIQALANDQFSDTEVVSISVLFDNSAPVLADNSPGLTAINEDDFTTVGDSVAAIVVDGSITDPDGAAVESIAITAVDDSNGTWQYSTDDGATWNDVDDGSLGVDHALLLDGTLVGGDTQRLRFVPDADYNGSAEITFRAWDMSVGVASSYADTTVSGGTSPFSTDTDTAGINVNAVNDVPTFLTLGDQNVLEDAGAQTIAGFAAALPGGGADESGQTFTYTVSSDNPGLFLVGPAIDASGTLTYTLNSNINGTATVTVSVTDSGGTANGGVDTSADQTFDIVVAAVNDVPSFSTLGDQNILEDAGPQTIVGFATALPGGGADESGQTFSYSVSSDNPGLFLVGPAIDASGTLTYTLNSNINGTATVTVSVTDSGGTANGGVDTSADQSFDIVVAAVNDVPSFSTLGDQNVLEDAGPQTVVGFATALPGGGADESGQTFSYSVSSDNPGLFLVGPAIDASGTLTYTLNSNINGTATVTVSVTDSGGTANGGVDTSADQSFDIVVAAVNDVPSFSTLGDQNVLEDAGAQTVVGFATALPGGGADESGQTFSYTVSSDNPTLFLVGPAIDASGTLTYTLNPDLNGTATVTVSVTDSGGTADGGVDTSADQTFDIVVAAVNDLPLFSTLGDQTVLEDAGAQTVVGFATALPGGGTDESGQTFTYTVSSDNPGLFLVGPAIDASGTLTYTLNSNINGTATVTVSVTDSGGTANGGVDTSADQSFDIVVAAVNDVPSFSTLGDQNVLEDAGAQTIVGFATALPGGGADESGQTFSYSVSSDNPGLFLVGPAIDASGTLTYTLNSNINGTATVTVSVTDSGGTANGGVDTAADQTFDIDVDAVNDAPTFSTLGDQFVLENSGVHSVAGFASAAPGGAADETGQNLSFVVASNNPTLFDVGPTIDDSGTLTYTLNPNVNGSARVAVYVTDSGGTANGGSNTSVTQYFDIIVGNIGDQPTLLVSTDGNVGDSGAPGLDSWEDSSVLGFGDPGFTLGPGAATSGVFTLAFDLAAFGPDRNVNGLHYVSSSFIIGSGVASTQFTLAAGDLLLTYDGGGGTYTGLTTSILVDGNDVFVFRPQAPGDYSNGEFYYLLDDPLTGSIQGIALVESAAVSVGDGPSLSQGTFLLSQNGGSLHDNIYTYEAQTIGNGTTTSALGGQILIDGEDTGDMTFDDGISGIHIIEEDSTIGGVAFRAGDLLLSLDKDQLNPAQGVGTTNQEVLEGDIIRLRLSETQQGPNGRSIGDAVIVLQGSSVGLDSGSEDINGLTVIRAEPNVVPTATNLTQSHDFLEDAASIALNDIVVSDANAGDTITARLVLADTAAGWFTIGSGNGETYDSGSGIWTVTGTLAQVNAALADVAFVPAFNSAASTTVTTQIEDQTGNGPADGLIALNATPVNDVPSFSSLGNQNVQEDSGPHTVAGFAAALPGGGADESGQTFSYTVISDNPGLFLVGPAIDASGTLTYTLKSNINGTATVTVSVTDSGGTANGGVDTSADQTFDIVVGAVNDVPSFSTLGDQTVLEDTGAQTVVGFATALPGGGADESGQTFTYAVSSNNPGLFLVGPAIDASGTLTYTLKSNINGTATVTVSVTDSGGTANGGVDTSANQTFDIVVGSVNDVPSFSTLGDQTVLEDAGPQTVVGFAASLPGGGADEAGQTFSYTVSSDNPGLFLVGPAIDASGTLTYTLKSNINGTATVTVSVTDSGGTANGGVDTSADQTFDIVVGAVNDVPSFSTLGDQTVLEDTGAQTVVGFATALPGGGADESGQTFTYTVSSNNPGLFLVGPAIDASGTLTYTLKSNINGTATVTVSVTDSGGTANGGVDTSANQTFDIVVGSVNDVPSFSTLGDQTVLEDTGAQTVVGFATALPGGGPDEAGQTFTYTVSSDNPGLFLVGPAIDASGTLTYTLKSNINGTATVTVSVTDSGGTAYGGIETSADQTFDIVVGAVNDAPSFSTLGDQNVLEDAGLQTVVGFATALPGGGTDESGQTFSYTVSSDNPGLFLVGPAIDASGTLTYTLNPNTSGTATVTVSLSDSGGTANGGLKDAADQTFDIIIASTDGTPTATNLNQVHLYLEDSGPVALHDILVNVAGNDGLISATLTLSNTAVGHLSTGSGNGETYSAANGEWTITGTVAQVNAALAAVAFVPVADNDVSTTVSTQVSNAAGQGPANGLVTLAVTPVNDAPTGNDRLISLLGDSVYTLSMADFGFYDAVEGDAPAGVEILFVPGSSVTLTNNGAQVETGQLISIDDISAGHLQIMSFNLQSVTSFANVAFRVQDAGGTVAGGSDFDPSANQLTFVVNPTNESSSTPATLPNAGSASAAAEPSASNSNGVPTNASRSPPSNLLPTAVTDTEALRTPVAPVSIQVASAIGSAFIDAAIPLFQRFVDSPAITDSESSVSQNIPGLTVEQTAAATGRPLAATTDDIAQGLDQMRNAIADQSADGRLMVNRSVAAVLGLSVGYVSWLLRGGVLLSSLLSSLPVWKFVDPLPVFARERDSDSDDDSDDSLAAIVKSRSDEIESRAKSVPSPTSAGSST